MKLYWPQQICVNWGGGEAKQLGFFTIAQVVKILMQKLALARYVNFIPFIIYAIVP